MAVNNPVEMPGHLNPLIHRIDDYLNAIPRAACDVKTVGPFTVFFRRTSDMPFLSYARPSGGPSVSLESAIVEVRREFKSRKRVARWE